MRRGILLAASTAAALAVAGPLANADHKPGHQQPPAGTNLTIGAANDTITWPRSTTVSGKLSGPESASQTIQLEEDPYPYGEFKRAATTQTDANGDYSFTVTPGLNTKYRATARIQGADVASGEQLVRVKMRVTRRVSDHTPKRGQTVVFSGFVGPAHDGRTVYIQRRNSEGVFKTVATTTLVDAGAEDASRSKYERDLRIKRDGVYRVLVRGHGDHVGNKSRRVRLDVP